MAIKLWTVDLLFFSKSCMIKSFMLSASKEGNDFGQMGFHICEFVGKHLIFCSIKPDFGLVSGLSFLVTSPP